MHDMPHLFLARGRKTKCEEGKKEKKIMDRSKQNSLNNNCRKYEELLEEIMRNFVP